MALLKVLKVLLVLCSLHGSLLRVCYAAQDTGPNPLVEKYLRLVEYAVTGSLHDEAGRCQSGWKGCDVDKLEPFDRELRWRGIDWVRLCMCLMAYA
jgi:hypothetical protein